ncbi:MAG TPA: 16S rRNA (cytosine(1402)-N(4))-methyltransferase RsmH, partial [Actinomycetota bacterium]|nr:16S rRNA (cytosine(1402)-N(4))-methyltransferase RsmH [Actinomycetota bacterium]
DALGAAAERLQRFGARFKPVRANFAHLGRVIREQGYGEVAAVLFDLGVSSPQLDRSDRGFSYRDDGPLDMRMDQQADLRAADVVNGYSQERLTQILFEYGEESQARRIARAIVRRRAQAPLTGTAELAEVVRAAIPAAKRRTGGHPARRSFQALRIEVNAELDSLKAALPAAVEVTAPGGRVVAISYHSLEDRIVKRTFADYARGCTCPRDLPICVCGKEATVRVLTKRAIRPSPTESGSNRRSESARMRVAQKLVAA